MKQEERGRRSKRRGRARAAGEEQWRRSIRGVGEEQEMSREGGEEQKEKKRRIKASRRGAGDQNLIGRL